MTTWSSSRRLTHLLLAGVIFLLDATATRAQLFGLWSPGQQVVQEHAISRVRVIGGGQPVAGAKDNVIFEPDLNVDCLPNTETKIQPIAATLDSSVTLEVSVVACQQGVAKPAPEVVCEWTLDPINPLQYHGFGFAGSESCTALAGEKISGQQSRSGFQGQIELGTLATVGIYQLEMSCKIQGTAILPPLSAPVFSVYSEPLTVVSPPKASWYALSACWAGGMSRDNSESDILEALLHGTYNYGRQLWRYGYAKKEDEGRFSFPIFSSQGGKSAIQYAIEDEALRPTCNSSGKCKCRWQGLVEPGALCNFSDCYIFSDVLHAMAAVMGVGGLRYQAIRGKAGLGFLTPKTSSLDLRFSRSVSCEKGAKDCYSYFFGNHSLRLRDDIYYDSTFLQTYNSPAQAVALDRSRSKNELLTFLDSNVELQPVDAIYGNWQYYVERSQETTRSERSRVVDIVGVTFLTTEQEGDERHERLVAEVEAEILRGGSYLVYGQLHGEDGGFIADQPDWWTTQPTVGIVEGKAGDLVKVPLYFSGQEIHQSGIDGRYRFSVRFYGEKVSTVDFSAWTPPYQSGDFGELGAAIQDAEVEITGVSMSTDRLFDHLKISVPFRVWREGLYTLEARLAKDTTTIAYAGEKRWFERGDHLVDLRVLGEKIGLSQMDGPYDLTLVHYDEHQAAKTSLQQKVPGLVAAQFVGVTTHSSK